MQNDFARREVDEQLQTGEVRFDDLRSGILESFQCEAGDALDFRIEIFDRLTDNASETPSAAVRLVASTRAPAETKRCEMANWTLSPI